MTYNLIIYCFILLHHVLSHIIKISNLSCIHATSYITCIIFLDWECVLTAPATARSTEIRPASLRLVQASAWRSNEVARGSGDTVEPCKLFHSVYDVYLYIVLILIPNIIRYDHIWMICDYDNLKLQWYLILVKHDCSKIHDSWLKKNIYIYLINSISMIPSGNLT